MKRPIHLLIVEDNQDVRLSYAASLRAIDSYMTFDESETLEGAVTACRGGNIDAVLLDLNLPDSTGLDTLKKLVALFPVLPIIVMTGTGVEAEEDAITAGAQDYVVKASNRACAAELDHIIRLAVMRKGPATGSPVGERLDKVDAALSAILELHESK